MEPHAHAWSTEDPEVRWLLELTSLPTAAGFEHHVIAWIDRWLSSRSDLAASRDPSGNIVIAPAHGAPSDAPQRLLFITAHLDHPAFVVERTVGPGTLVLSFRGGVREPYFKDARLKVFPASGGAGVAARLLGSEGTLHFPMYLAEVEGDGASLNPGDIARWDLPDPRIEGDIIYTHACDDLAAVAAALATIERLRRRPEASGVRLLLTRAEEIGFVGAIAACKHGTIDPSARVIALENSRAFAESPIGAGPIVRVGDRISTFSPRLTGAVAKVAEELTTSRGGSFRWQRRLMPGGACEASAFQAYGLEATCVCLPLGNYHNMADLERVLAGDASAIASARPGHEHVSISDYKGMIDLLEACACGLGEGEPMIARMERMYALGAFVLTEHSPSAGAQRGQARDAAL